MRAQRYDIKVNRGVRHQSFRETVRAFIDPFEGMLQSVTQMAFDRLSPFLFICQLDQNNFHLLPSFLRGSIWVYTVSSR